jgi:lipid II:glycine glycyltransferase (peptidoglycan interpeptide bridge formation enzyme)
LPNTPNNSAVRYHSEIDHICRDEWYQIIDQFSDANIYQTWDYDAARFGYKNQCRFVLRKNGQIVAACIVRIVRLPLIGNRAAYVRWGPMFRTNTANEDPEIFRRTLRALKDEFVSRRGLLLRIYPVLFYTNSYLFQKILHEEGYQSTPNESEQYTLILDIRPSLVDIRKNFKQKWRNCLNKSEKFPLDVTKGTGDQLFTQFIELYAELLERKKFEPPNDINEFRRIQQDLPAKQKMEIFICSQAGRPTAGGIFSLIGDTGIYLFGATNDEGMKNNSSYLIQWKAIQWMKNKGCLYYNLNGVNKMTNPGGYRFKSGVSGKTDQILQYLGRYDCYSGPITRTIVQIGNRLLPQIKKLITH